MRRERAEDVAQDLEDEADGDGDEIPGAVAVELDEMQDEGNAEN